MKRHEDKTLQDMTPFRGTKHSMHRKDGVAGNGKSGKLQYQDLGYSYDSKPVEAGKNAKHYPGLHIDAGKMPDLAACKIGEDIELVVKAKITGAHQSDGRGHSFDLEVREAALKKT